MTEPTVFFFRCTANDVEPEAWIIASESCTFLSIGAKYEREILPGEIVEITRRGVQTVSIVERPDSSASAFCIFEYVYFARADSIFEGTSESTAPICSKILLASNLCLGRTFLKVKWCTRYAYNAVNSSLAKRKFKRTLSVPFPSRVPPLH